MRCALMQGFSQVYGGTTSIFIGSYSKASVDTGQSPSNAQSGDTHCSGCAVSVSDVAIINSFAITTGKCDTRFTLRCYCCSFCPKFMVLFVFCDGCRIDLLFLLRKIRLQRSVCTSSAVRHGLYVCD
jgi:hypothetical protein